jgi:hypothetical protein
MNAGTDPSPTVAPGDPPAIGPSNAPIAGAPGAPAASLSEIRPPVPSTPVAPAARIPSLARRLTIGSIRLVLLLLLYVGVPVIGLSILAAHGLASSFPIPTVTVFGAVLSILSTARYVGRPTLAYGPLCIVTSAGGILYFLYFSGLASVSLHLSNVSIELVFGALLALLALVPAFGLAAGVVTTVEDARHPGERLPFDYPA